MKIVFDTNHMPRMFYTKFGRVCHGYSFNNGVWVMDDYGNAIKSGSASLRVYMIQEH